MFKKLFDRMLEAKTAEQLFEVVYGPEGVNRMYEREKISWADHERLFTLAERLAQTIEGRSEQ